MLIKNIAKKIVGPVFVLLLISGGVFYWQNNQKDVREFNKNLPVGVKVAKNIFGFGQEYKVVNKIDGYEFKVPSAWKGIEKIEYEDVIDTDLSIKKQTKEKGMDIDAMPEYAMIFKYGIPPHGGVGFGLDRLTQRLLGLANVREAVLLPRDPKRLGP